MSWESDNVGRVTVESDGIETGSQGHHILNFNILNDSIYIYDSRALHTDKEVFATHFLPFIASQVCLQLF
jgi:hypothetical protein